MNSIDCISLSGLNKVFQTSDVADRRVMVFGFSHCFFEEVQNGFDGLSAQVLNYSAGDDYNDEEIEFQIPSGADDILFENMESDAINQKRITRICKAALVSGVLNNYRYEQSGEGKFIPIVFCIDTQNNPFPLKTEHWTAKQSSLITHTELRRAFKLCHDHRVNPEVRAVVQKTFQFMRVEVRNQNPFRFFDFKPMSPPWESEDFSFHWNQRQCTGSWFEVKTGWREHLHRLCSGCLRR